MFSATLTALTVMCGASAEQLRSQTLPSLAIQTQLLDSPTADENLFEVGGEHGHSPHGHGLHGHGPHGHSPHGHGHHGHSRKMLVSLAESTAACGEFFEDTDFPGNDVPGEVVTDTAQLCVDACKTTATCDAVSWLTTNGRCYVKNIPEGFEGKSVARFTSYRLCPDEVGAVVKDVEETQTPYDAPPVEFDSRSNPHPDQTAHPLLPPEVDEGTPPRTSADVRALEQGAHAWFDYQISGAYNPSLGTLVVSRDWFYGEPLFNQGSYSICHINAFQTLPDEGAGNTVRPDVTSNWPAEVVMQSMEDPESPGEYVIDISTPAKREAASSHVAQMLTTCEDKLFSAVEFANLDSFVRYSNAPFTKDDAVEYATMLVSKAHSMGLAAAQQNTIELIDTEDYKAIGFDFAVVERCGENRECEEFRDAYGGRMVAVEYTQEGFESACHVIGDTSAVVMRDTALSTPDSGSYVMKQCGP